MKSYISVIALSGLLMTACGDGPEKNVNNNEEHDLAEVETVNNNMDAARMNTIDESRPLIAVARENENLQKFSDALVRADMKQAFNGEEAYTLFVPSDEAFEALPEEKWNSLKNDEKTEDLKKVLSLHVVPGTYTMSDIENEIRNNDGSYTLTTKEGSQLTFTEEEGKIVLKDENNNEAHFENNDLKADNGYVHVIDAVFLPM